MEGERREGGGGNIRIGGLFWGRFLFLRAQWVVSLVFGVYFLQWIKMAKMWLRF